MAQLRITAVLCLTVATLGAATCVSTATSKTTKKPARYVICDSGKEHLIPAASDFTGCYVDDSAANIRFARKVVDKQFTDKLEPKGDNFGNTPQGKIDCKAFFDRKDQRSGFLHCIRTFVWIHTHPKPEASHRGTCKSEVVMTYTMAGTTRRGGKMFLRMKPTAIADQRSWNHQEFALYYGKTTAPQKRECPSWTEHEDLEVAPLVPDDPLDVPPLTDPSLDPA